MHTKSSRAYGARSKDITEQHTRHQRNRCKSGLLGQVHLGVAGIELSACCYGFVFFDFVPVTPQDKFLALGVLVRTPLAFGADMYIHCGGSLLSTMNNNERR